MCRINWRPEAWEYDYPSPSPRPVPRLAWSLPVDIVELGASLEAYSNQIQQNTTLRLCHRFGHGPLSKVPQEILDQIIGHEHEAMKQSLRPKWTRNYLCFQDRCSPIDHFQPDEDIFDGIWMHLMEAGWNISEADKDLDEYTEEERVEMVKDYLNNCNYNPYDELQWEIHDERQDAWLNQICRCSAPTSAKPGVGFEYLNELLKKHFGLDAIMLHEVLSDDLVNFLPDANGFSECSYYTTCFLSLAAPMQTSGPTQVRTATHRNDVYLAANNHMAFHQTIDPNDLNISNQQKLCFARGMRVLGLQLFYHLTELETLITANSEDEALWAISHGPLRGRPKPTQEKPAVKRKLLSKYLQAKSQELAKQTWPQLKIMSTSDAVAPH